MTTDERDIILAALRLYQHVHEQTGGDIPDEILDTATDGESHKPIDLEAIDELCDRINIR